MKNPGVRLWVKNWVQKRWGTARKMGGNKHEPPTLGLTILVLTLTRPRNLYDRLFTNRFFGTRSRNKSAPPVVFTSEPQTEGVQTRGCRLAGSTLRVWSRSALERDFGRVRPDANTTRVKENTDESVRPEAVPA